ncbi:hypothetical protein [Lysobacter gummosus]
MAGARERFCGRGFSPDALGSDRRANPRPTSHPLANSRHRFDDAPIL